MITNKKLKPFFLLFTLFGFVVASVFMSIENDRMFARYSQITKETTLIGNIESTKRYKSATIFEVEQIEYIFYDAYNYNYEMHFMYDFIQVGDSIYKEYNSDSLFVLRENNRFYFMVND